MFSGISKILWISALVSMTLCSVAYARNNSDSDEFKGLMAEAGAMVKQDLAKALQSYLEIRVRFSEPEIEYSLGRTYQRLGQCQEAMEYYSQIMASVSDDNPIFMRTVESYDEIASCESWQKIRLDCDMPKGSYIMLDNERIGSCWSRPISLVDGEHTIKLISADGSKEVAQTIKTTSNEPDITVTLAFEKEEVIKEVIKTETIEKSYILKDKYSPELYWGVMAGGVAVMGLSGIFFGLAHQSNSEEIKYADLYASTGDTEYLQKSRDARNDLRKYNIATYTILGIGGAAALTGVILAVINATCDKERVEVEDDFTATIAPSDGGVTLGLGWRF